MPVIKIKFLRGTELNGHAAKAQELRASFRARPIWDHGDSEVLRLGWIRLNLTLACASSYQA
jgi:hypothetical protein